MTRMPSRRRQSGFSLLEVLIAVLVLAIGLLGLAGLQSLSLRYNDAAYLRSQAVQLAYDMTDRVRVNPESVTEFPTASGPDDTDLFDGENFGDLPADPGCIHTTDGCDDPGEIGDYDFRIWNHHIRDRLPGGYGVVYRPDANPDMLEVAVRWTERVDADGDDEFDEQTFVLRFNP